MVEDSARDDVTFRNWLGLSNTKACALSELRLNLGE